MSRPPYDDPDDLLDRIAELLSSEPDPFPWADAMTWVAPDTTHDATTARVYLDMVGWTL